MRRIFPDAILGFLVGLVLASSFLFTVLAVSSSQEKICKRQQRSSIAVPFLIASMDEIHGLLTLPPDKSSKQRINSLPPKIRDAEKQLVTDLDNNLTAFVRIEREQPKLHC